MVLIGTLLTSLLGAGVATAPGYDYPIADPRVATIIGTPSEWRADLPATVPVEHERITVFPGREVPRVFWYYPGFAYSFIAQRHRAPLVFVIAGTGAGHTSGKMDILGKLLYQSGMHVVLLSSPTHPNFIVTASSTAVPGDLEQDAGDLYRVMELIWGQIRGRVDASEFHVTGYSLGGAQAAFVARLDEERRTFNFRRVLMLNPPMSLYSSVQILDRMLADSIPGGERGFAEFFEAFMADVTRVYAIREDFDFSSDFFYRLYQERDPSLMDEPLRQRRTGALIGLSFRIALAGMAFTADVMNHVGYIVPRGRELGRTDSTSEYLAVAARRSFDDYVRRVFAPYYLPRQPGETLESLIAANSLRRIEGYLRRSGKIGLVHNEDDIILSPGEMDWFRRVFGPRAQVFPRGGHCGNLDHRDVVAHISGFFKP